MEETLAELVEASGAEAPFWRWGHEPSRLTTRSALQGGKFDPDRTYVRRWAPDLATLLCRYVPTPWAAPNRTLAAGGVKLGEIYPAPIVEHARARPQALAAWRALGGGR